MKLSLNLLKQFVKISLKPQALADLLSERAFEVEGFEIKKPDFSKVVTAKVLTVEKHPNADRLRVVSLSLGKQTIAPVVCGAHNFEAGDIVALALPGAYVPKNAHDPSAPGATLDKATIRGVESQGMICAEFELGLTNQVGEGIMLLPKETKPGQDFAKLLGEDVIFDVSLPANRPDLFSHLGVAREIAAVTNQPLKEPKVQPIKSTKKTLPVKVEAKDHCSRYIAVEMTNVVIADSPLWLQQVLKNLGLRPINNVVDITNYVALELGQPLHAFDKSLVNSGITVRLAKKGEHLETLDHKDRALTEEVLVIADKEKALAVAGVIGGSQSEISSTTKTIILESASFNPITVRKSAQLLGVRTDSSAKFEKGLHPNQASLGAHRAIELLTALAGAKTVAVSEYNQAKNKQISIRFSSNNISALVGKTYKPAEITQALKRYGVKVTGQATMTALPPYYRQDITTAEDLAEEVIKIQGINNIPHIPLMVSAQLGESSLPASLRKTKDLLVGMGYSETQNYSFISATDIIHYGDDPKEYVQVANPLSNDQGYLKKHIEIPLLKNVARNSAHTNDIALFEIGKEYHGYENEPLIIALVRAGKVHAVEQMLAEVKGDTEKLVEALGAGKVGYQIIDKQILAVKAGESRLGYIKIISKEISDRFDVNVPFVCAHLEAQSLFALIHDATYQSISKFPAVHRDLSVIIPADTTWQSIEAVIRPLSPLIQNFAIVEADYLAVTKESKEFHASLAKKSQKNLGIRITLQSPDKTLTDQEISGIMDQIMLKLRQEIKAEIR